MRAFLLVTIAMLLGVNAARAEPTPQQRARALIDLQAKAIDDRNEDVLYATFTQDAVILVPDPRPMSRGDQIDAIRRTSPHESLNSAKVGKFVAGGDANAIWLDAELAVDVAGAEPGYPMQREVKMLRVTELATADTGWKVVAAAFSEPGSLLDATQPSSPIEGKSEPPTDLSELLASPVKLEAALAKDASVAVFGSGKGEIAYGGPPAHALLKSWSKLALSLSGAPREMHGKGWAFALGYVDWKRKPSDKFPARMSGLVIAQPAANNTWTVVAVHYTSGD